MFSEKWKSAILTVPNLLSVFRILLIPVYMLVYLNATGRPHYLLAGSILALSCMTDLVDGIIARRYGQITNLGKILDPLADKLTQLSLLFSLSQKHDLLYSVLGLFLAKELFQCGALLFFVQKGKVLTGALFAGKICTTVLFVSLIFLVLFPEIPPKAVLFLTYLDAGFLLYSFFSYIYAYLGNGNCLTDWNQTA